MLIGQIEVYTMGICQRVEHVCVKQFLCWLWIRTSNLVATELKGHQSFVWLVMTSFMKELFIGIDNSFASLASASFES